MCQKFDTFTWLQYFLYESVCLFMQLLFVGSMTIVFPSICLYVCLPPCLTQTRSPFLFLSHWQSPAETPSISNDIKRKKEGEEWLSLSHFAQLSLSLSLSLYHLQTVWPDLLYFGPLFAQLATINLPKSPTLLGNFCKGVKFLSFF